MCSTFLPKQVEKDTEYLKLMNEIWGMVLGKIKFD